MNIDTILLMCFRYLKLYFLFFSGALVSSSEESRHIYFRKLNQEVNLEDYLLCESWVKNYKDQDKKFIMKRESISFYMCTSSHQLLYLFAIDEEMSFESRHKNHEPSKEFFAGEIVRFRCGLPIISRLERLTSILIIYDVNKTLKATTNATFNNRTHEHTIDASFQINVRGVIPFYCSWVFSVVDDDLVFKNAFVKNLSITVYSPPINVRPDKASSEIDEAINCMADAYPEAVYFWNCSGGKWNVNESFLVYSESGVFLCTCTAQNSINGSFMETAWNGKISVSEASTLIVVIWILIVLVGLTVTLENINKGKI